MGPVHTMNWLILLDGIQKMDKNFQGRQFIVIDLTRAKEDPPYSIFVWVGAML